MIGGDQNTPDDNEPDDIRHLVQAIDATSRSPDFQQMTSAVNLLGQGLSLVPLPTFDLVGPNDFSTVACLSRGYRQLRGATVLLMHGYYGEVRVLLRAAYECACLSRVLAKNPDRAEQWLRKLTWFPNSQVNKWWARAGSSQLESPEEMLGTHRHAYHMMSSWAHPTAMSCLALVAPSPDYPDRMGLHLDTTFSEADFQGLVAEIAGTAIFTCFALRNSAVSERAIPPDWRKRLYELAPLVLNKSMPHLQRDWQEENQRYEELQQRIQSAAEIAEKLRTHRSSWDNLQKSGPST